MNGVILLIHAMNYPDRTDEDRPYTYLGEIIDTLRSKGYTFKTMFDL
jgi:peptidoglycan/xylan/chitin deacetylase (PgdA/CDA1 family)